MAVGCKTKFYELVRNKIRFLGGVKNNKTGICAGTKTIKQEFARNSTFVILLCHSWTCMHIHPYHQHAWLCHDAALCSRGCSAGRRACLVSALRDDEAGYVEVIQRILKHSVFTLAFSQGCLRGQRPPLRDGTIWATAAMPIVATTSF
jgi:hypothetical protein